MKAGLKKIYLTCNHYGMFNFVPDRVLIPVLYRIATGKKLDLQNPVTFNEKIQWLKLYDKNPLYTIIADKYKVRSYVAEKVGEQYLIPLLAKWDKVEQIDFAKLPDQFVLKCNHDSGGVVICTNKEIIDVRAIRRKLKYHFKQNQYYVSREWSYKDIKKCIICEKYMVDDAINELRDYKFFCFAGEPKIIQVDFDRFKNHKRNLYTVDWKFLDFSIKCPNDSKANIEKPENLEDMLKVARALSCGLPQVRVDLYSVNGKTYFGELTLYHGGGIENFSSEEYAIRMGSWIDLKLAYSKL